MKISKVTIENFKGIKGPLEIDFTGPDGEPRPVTCIVGDNGSGKTTVLQAIALTLGLATGKVDLRKSLDWPGFMPERVSSHGIPNVRSEMVFSGVEIDAADALNGIYLDRLKALGSHSFESEIKRTQDVLGMRGQPTRTLTFALQGDVYKAIDNQWRFDRFLMGRRHFRQQPERSRPAEFGLVGDVVWFDQNRNIAYTSAKQQQNEASNGHSNGSDAGWAAGVGKLREGLRDEWLVHMNAWHDRLTKGISPPDPTDTFITRLQGMFNSVFGDVVFAKAGPRKGALGTGPDDIEVLFRRGENTYELAEMSSGEQAVFPLMYEFARQDIRNSVVLIDELELHLHPPQQQALLAAIRDLAKSRDCQFIVTTHSEDVASGFFDDEIARLPGGRPCL